MPAQSSGAAPAGSSFSERAARKLSSHNDAVRVAAIGDAAENFVFGVVGESRTVFAILLFARQAVCAVRQESTMQPTPTSVSFLEFLHGAAQL